jgi:hypothetical protein
MDYDKDKMDTAMIEQVKAMHCTDNTCSSCSSTMMYLMCIQQIAHCRLLYVVAQSHVQHQSWTVIDCGSKTSNAGQ